MTQTMELEVTEEKKETVGEQLARELAEKTREILDGARSALDANTRDQLNAEPMASRVKGVVDKLSVFVSASNIRFTVDGGSLYVLSKDSPIVEDGETGIVLVTLEEQAPVA